MAVVALLLIDTTHRGLHPLCQVLANLSKHKHHHPLERRDRLRVPRLPVARTDHHWEASKILLLVIQMAHQQELSKAHSALKTPATKMAMHSRR